MPLYKLKQNNLTSLKIIYAKIIYPRNKLYNS